MAQHRTSREEQREHIDRWIESGLSKAAYCRLANVPYHLLLYWSRQHTQRAQEEKLGSAAESGFIELTAASSSRPGSGMVLPAVVIRLPGGVELACGSFPDAQWIRQLTQGPASC